jgi:transcriptional regulator with XRE-family HTH domain
VEDQRPWLSSRTPGQVELNTGLLAEVLREYRESNGVSQADLAQLLHLDQSYVSKIETGKRQVGDLETLLQIAHRLNVPPSRLGLSHELLQPVPSSTSLMFGAADSVKVSQGEWRRDRRYLNGNRGDLARLAAELYTPAVRVGDIPFIARTEWMPEAPVRLEDIELCWSDYETTVTITGTEAEAHDVLPLRAPGKRFDRYTSAIRYLAPPSLFENRASYRLLEANLEPGQPRTWPSTNDLRTRHVLRQARRIRGHRARTGRSHQLRGQEDAAELGVLAVTQPGR